MILERAAALAEAELWSEPLAPVAAEPGDVLASLAEDGHSFALTGRWAGSAAIVGSAPLHVLPPGEDPFAHLTFTGGTPGGAVGGGWFGILGYQLGAHIEALPPAPPRPIPLDQSWLGLYDHVLRLDREGRWWFEALVTPDRATALEQRFRTLRLRLEQSPGPPGPFSCGQLGLTPGPDTHVERVDRLVQHIHAGDLFQANLCLRVEGEFRGSPLAAFRQAAARLQPPFAGFFDMGDRAVASLSPELFLRRSGRRVLTSPIKGTIRRNETDATEADAARVALEASGKDRAENVMIVDLMRNDLSRVCAAGTVQVPDVARAEAHPGVWHLVSDVEGTLSDGVDDGEVLRACFPPGSVTGAPKVRAMELINELEATGREAYTGAIGFSSPLAGLETNVVIRTFEFGHDRVWLGVGGGIVADSDPELEYRECLVKAEPLVAALDAEIEPGTALADRKALAAREAEEASPLGGPVFETVLVVDGVAIDLHAHLTRLRASGAPSHRMGELSQRVQRTARALSPGRHRLRIDVAPRGGGRATSKRVDSSGEVTVVESKDVPGRAEVGLATEPVATPSEPADEPARLRPVDIPGGHGPHKVAGRDRLAAIDGDEPLVTDGDEVLETGWGNVFAVTGRTIRTPVTDGRILPGTVRAWALRAAPSLGLSVEEAPLTRADLEAAEEVFVTSAIRGVQPAESCVDIGSWPTGPVTRRLAEAWADHVDRTVARHRGWVDRARDPWPPRGPLGPGRLVVVDNYDSFTFNLVHHLGELGADPVIVRNDEVTADEIISARPRGIVLSPGPAGPDDAGICVELIETIDPTTPLLGVCLGHQCMGAAYGAAVVRAPEVIHGKTSEVHHDGQGVFRGLPDPMVATRYHSLMVDEATLPDQLQVTARTDDGLIMGLRHADRPLYGVQFHPESVLTEHGRRLLANFLAATGSC